MYTDSREPVSLWAMFPIGPPHRCFTQFAPPSQKDPNNETKKRQAVNCVKFETSHGILAVLLKPAKQARLEHKRLWLMLSIQPSPRWRIAVLTGHN